MGYIDKYWENLSKCAKGVKTRRGGSLLSALGRDLVARVHDSAAGREFRRRRELCQHTWSQARSIERIETDRELLSSRIYLDQCKGEDCHPDTLLIEATTRCNLQCVQCVRSSVHYEKGDMEWETFQRTLPLIKKAKSVWFFGCGEPFLHPRYFEMIKIIKDLGARVHTTTNGTIITPYVAERIVRNRLDCLTFSIDAASDRLYSAIRKGAKLKDVMCNFREVVRLKKKMGSNVPHLSIEFVAMKMNIHELPQMVDLARELEAGTLTVANLLEYSNVEGQSIVGDPQAYKGYVLDAMNRARKEHIILDINPRLKSAFEVNGKIPSKRYIQDVLSEKDLVTTECEMPWNFAFVNWEGNILPCCEMAGYFGNLRTDSIEEIWKNEKYISLRKEILVGQLSEKCRDCPSKRLVRIEPIESFVEMGINDGLEGISVSRQLGRGWRNRDAGEDGAASPPFRWTRRTATAFLKCDSSHTMLWIEASGGNRSVNYEMLVNDEARGDYVAPRNRFSKNGIGLPFSRNGLIKVSLKVMQKESSYAEREEGIAVRRIWLA